MNGPQRHRGTEFEHINNLTGRIIGAAIEVHRALGLVVLRLGPRGEEVAHLILRNIDRRHGPLHIAVRRGTVIGCRV